jgi:hypothetical protein
VPPPRTRPPDRERGDFGGDFRGGARNAREDFEVLPQSPEYTPQQDVTPPRVDMDFGLLEYMRPNQRVELGPEPAAAPAPQDAPLPPMADFALYDFIQPAPVQGEAPVAAPAAPEGAPPPSMADFDFLNYIQPVPVPAQTETAAAVQPAPAQDYGVQDMRARIPPELIMAAQPQPASADSGVAEAPPPPSMADFELLNYIQPMPVPVVELPPEAVPYQPGIVEPEQAAPVPAAQPKVPPPPPGAPELQIDPELLRYLMMSGFGAEEAML